MGINLWANLVLVLIVGYVTMGRSFAYIGLVPLKVFIGEVALGAALLFRPREVLSSWWTGLLRTGRTSGLSWAFLLCVAYGLIQAVRGILLDRSLLTVLQNLAFNYYPLFLFIGIWTGTRRPALLARTLRILAIWNAFYGMVYLFYLSRLTLYIPGSDKVHVFGQVGGSAVSLLGLLAFEQKGAFHWLLVAVNAFILLGVQVRAEWLGFMAALLVWAIFSGRLGRTLVSLSVIAAFLAVGYLADFSMPAPSSRGGTISSKAIVGRALASIDQEAAQELTPNAKTYAGTVSWRTEWWHAIWDGVHSSPETTLFGFGYGYPIGDFVSYLRGEDIRTPHSILLFVLAYGGWVGTILFFGFQAMIARQLWRAFKVTGQSFGVAFWILAMVGSMLGNVFETPFGAIPFYLLAGVCMAPACSNADQRVKNGAQLVILTRAATA